MRKVTFGSSFWFLAGSNWTLYFYTRVNTICVCFLYLQVCVFPFVDEHDGGLITASVAIVRRWEHSDHIALVAVLIPLHHQLMRACYSIQPVCMVELFRDILSEGVACSSWWNTPAQSLVWIWPYQVAKWTFLRHLFETILLSYLIDIVNTGGKTSVQAEHLAIDKRREWQEVK